jgi:carbon monoxide dehydrogenase subunit G
MNEVEKKRFEVKMRLHPDGSIEKQIFIGGEMLDWSVDSSSFLEAKKMGPQYMRAVQDDIAKHFIESVGEFLGRRVTLDDIKEAIKTGWI